MTARRKGAVILMVLVVLILELVMYFHRANQAAPLDGKYFQIVQEGVLIYEGPLSPGEDGETRELRFTGLDGEYVVEVNDGEVRMLAAHCPDKLCVKQGWVSHTYEPIICLPQKVVITVNKGGDVDGVTR